MQNTWILIGLNILLMFLIIAVQISKIFQNKVRNKSLTSKSLIKINYIAKGSHIKDQLETKSKFLESENILIKIIMTTLNTIMNNDNW